MEKMFVAVSSCTTIVAFVCCVQSFSKSLRERCQSWSLMASSFTLEQLTWLCCQDLLPGHVAAQGMLTSTSPRVSVIGTTTATALGSSASSLVVSTTG